MPLQSSRGKRAPHHRSPAPGERWIRGRRCCELELREDAPLALAECLTSVDLRLGCSGIDAANAMQASEG